MADIRTKTFHAIYNILECQGYLQNVCPGLIDDILQEIKSCESDNVTFSVDLHCRCKIAGPILEHKMLTLQKVVIRQHRNLNLKNHAQFLNCLFQEMLPLAFVVALLVFTLSFLSLAYSKQCKSLIWAVRDMTGLLALIVESNCLPLTNISSDLSGTTKTSRCTIWMVMSM
ncbi:hypothetical protein IW262DRAFT_1299415 [Armillaria fumosa]|nr:hypothetical protein IW262DRAFT_1299415 [Armillaria fumosa]